MSAPLYFYPAYQSVKTIADPEHKNATHWLTFWVSACILEQIIPVQMPWWITTPALTLMYIPDTTDFVRERLLFPGTNWITESIPVIKQKALDILAKYRTDPRLSDEAVIKKWYQFW